MTPRQFTALLDRHKDQVEHDQLMFGLVASTIFNRSYPPPEKPVSAEDFMPSRYEKRRREREQESANELRAFAANYMKNYSETNK